MKRFLAFCAPALMLVAAITGCSSTPTLTFPQQVSIACGAMKGEIVILQGDGVFTGGAADTLSKDVSPAVDKVCAAGATVTSADLQTIVNAALPAVKSIVDTSSLPADKKKIADAAIDTGVLAFNVAISMAPAITSTAAPASAVPAASAPAAASTPLAAEPLK